MRTKMEARVIEKVSLVDLGKAISRLREDSGLSQAGLGKAIGLDQTRISRYEAGKEQIPIDRLAAIEQVFGVPGQLWQIYIEQSNILKTLTPEELLKLLDYAKLLIRARSSEMAQDKDKALAEVFNQIEKETQKEEKDLNGNNKGNANSQPSNPPATKAGK